MGWEFNVDTQARGCAQCAKDTLADMATGSHSFTLDRIGATFKFAPLVEGEPICRQCAAALLVSAAQQLEGR